MNSLRFAQKMLLMGFIVSLLLLWFMYHVIADIQSAIMYNHQVIDNIKYNSHLISLIRDIQQHRGMTNAYLRGSSFFLEEIKIKQKQIKTGMDNLSGLKPSQQFEPSLLNTWNIIEHKLSGTLENALDNTPEKSWTEHSDIIHQTIDLMTQNIAYYHLGKHDNVFFYYFINLFFHQIPIYIENVGQLRGFGSGIIAKKSITDKERQQLIMLLGVTNSGFLEISENIDKIFVLRPDVRVLLEKDYKKVESSLERLVHNINDNLIGSNLKDLNIQEYFSNSSQTIDLGILFLSKSSNFLKYQAEKTINTLLWNLYGLLILVTFTLLTLLYLFIGNYYSVVKGFKSLIEGTNLIAKGQLNQLLKIESKDELSDLTESFNDMIIALRNTIQYREDAEKALKESEELFRVLSEASPAGLILYMDKIIYANPVAENVTGYSKDELLFKNPKDLIHPDILAQQALSDEPISNERFYSFPYDSLKIITKQGVEKWLQISSSKVEYQGKEAGLAIFIDFTEHKLAQEALIASEKKYGAFINATSEGFCVLDHQNKLVEVNDSLCAMLGCSPDLIGKPFLDFVDKKYHAKFKEQVEDDNLISHKRMELELNHQNGSKIPIIFLSTTVSDDQQNLVSSFAFITNIEQRKKTEEELKRTSEILAATNLNLEQKINDEVVKSREKDQLLFQQSRYAQMGEMLSMIAHQWRQPLNAISTAAIEISLSDTLGDYDPAKTKELTGFIESQTQNMSSIINDFMDFFRPEKEKESFYLNRVFDTISKMSSAQISLKNIRLINNIESDIQLISFQKELEQVLINLISNSKDAYEFSPSEDQEIIFSANETDDYIELIVEDKGGGVNQEVLDRIFDPYFTTKEQGKGTGIGLFMSKNIVEKNLGGKIAAKNTMDGLQIILTLPK